MSTKILSLFFKKRTQGLMSVESAIELFNSRFTDPVKSFHDLNRAMTTILGKDIFDKDKMSLCLQKFAQDTYIALVGISDEDYVDILTAHQVILDNSVMSPTH